MSINLLSDGSVVFQQKQKKNLRIFHDIERVLCTIGARLFNECRAEIPRAIKVFNLKFSLAI